MKYAWTYISGLAISSWKCNLNGTLIFAFLSNLWWNIFTIYEENTAFSKNNFQSDTDKKLEGVSLGFPLLPPCLFLYTWLVKVREWCQVRDERQDLCSMHPLK